MAPSPLQQRRTHNTLLFQKLLNLRDGASPFTLVLDTLEQSGTTAIQEFVRRAKIGKSKIIAISFSTLRKKLSFDPDVFISARAKTLSSLRTEIVSHLPTPMANSTTVQKFVVIIDCLNPLASTHPAHLPNFLQSILGPNISLLATYHTDIPLPAQGAYQPEPLTTLIYSATAILIVQNLAHVLARKKAQDKSRQPPVFGLAEHREGVLVGLSNSSKDLHGVVIEMEIRRKSGRGVSESFVLSPSSSVGKVDAGNVMLLDDHPSYSVTMDVPVVGNDDGDVETTFSLGLSEKQRRDRDGVVLPYFDTQKEGGASGPGEGGRILYEMGAEDREDFDDEEDEI